MSFIPHAHNNTNLEKKNLYYDVSAYLFEVVTLGIALKKVNFTCLLQIVQCFFW
jgi:hypothetical protein